MNLVANNRKVIRVNDIRNRKIEAHENVVAVPKLKKCWILNSEKIQSVLW